MSAQEKYERPVLPPGTILDDRFEIVKRLGGGNFGSVYRARQIVFGRQLREVALKLFDDEKVTAKNIGDKLSDAITLIGLQEENPSPAVSQHMIQVYDIGLLKTPVEHVFMSMKLAPGGKTLETAVRRWRHGGMPVAAALGYLRQILVPLEWMHTLDPPAIHADLKPNNVLLTEDYKLILADFGLAARLPLGSAGGAILYQAPETLVGETAHEPADIYGLGVMLYEMLTGRHPFADVGLEATAAGDERAHIRAHYLARMWEIRPARASSRNEEDQRIVPASEVNQELLDHPQVEAMLNRCLKFRQSERYPNARLLLADVDRYLQTGALPDTVIPNPIPASEMDPKTTDLPGKTPEMLLADAVSLFNQGRHEAASERVGKVLKDSPNFIPAMLALARILAARGDLQQARAWCEKAQNQDRNNPDIYQTLADIYQESKPALAQNMRKEAERLRAEMLKSARRP